MDHAEVALTYVKDGSVVGLGSGRAAHAFIEVLARRVREGLRVLGVPTSLESARLATAKGIPLTVLHEDLVVDVTVDGADEVDPSLDLIKGYGGAMVRERIVAAASNLRVILVGPEKLVPALGSRGRVPVEVVPFALQFARRSLHQLGCPPTTRAGDAGPFVTDNGNMVLDCRISPSIDPVVLDRAIRDIPGVVGTGFFLGTTDVVLVGHPTGSVEVRLRKRREG